MLVQHIAPDGCRLNRATQYLRRFRIIGLQTQVEDLAHRGIAQQIVGNLERDLHRDLGGALVAFGRVFVFIAIRFFLLSHRTVGQAADCFGAVGGGTADVAYPVGGLDIAHRAPNLFVPDFPRLALVEPSHCYIFKYAYAWNLSPVRSVMRTMRSDASIFIPGNPSVVTFWQQGLEILGPRRFFA